MATQVQFRRGTTTQNNAFTGAAGEITYDTDIKTLRLHDGLTQGGGAIVATTQATQTLLNKTHSTGSVWNGSVVGLLYGGTGGAITAVPGAIAYSTNIGFGLSLAGTSGQVLISGGTSGPSWVASTSLQAGNAVNSTYATNVAGGSAGQLVIQQDNSLTTFITAGASGTFLRSEGAGYAPSWQLGQVTYGSTTVAFGQTSTSLAGLTSIDSTAGATSFFNSPASATLFASASTITIGNAASGTLTLNSGTVVGANTTQNVFNTVATTLNAFGAATQLNIGNATAATVTLRPGTVVGSNTTQNLWNTTATTVNAFGAATAINIGAATGTLTINNAQVVLNSTTSLQLPAGTTAQRPGTPVVGQIRYNSTISSYEGYASGAWSSLGGVKSVDGLTYIIAETSAGASNDELEFYTATDASTTAKRGGWNATRLLVSNNTASTSTSTGALQVAGGVGIGGAVYVGGTLNVAGNLSVSGTTTTTNSQSLTVTTPQLFLASDNAGNSTDVGLLGGYTVGGTAKKTGLVKQAASGEWRLFSNTTAAPGTTYDFTGAVYDTLRLGSLIATANSSVTGTLSVSGMITATGGVTGEVTGNSSTATKLATARTIALTGDATASASFDGSANYSAALTLANSGVTAGTYTFSTITVDAKGRVTSASSNTVTGTSANTANTLVQRDGSGNSYHGTLYAGAFQISSDERLKSDIKESSYGLKEILSLNSVQYVKEGRHEIGLIAQQVEPLMPEFVADGDDGYKSLNYNNMVSVLIKAVQELSAEVNALKAKLGE